MINLIGQKMRAAALFYGDEATGALVEEEEGDLLSALVQVAMGKIQIGQADSLFNITPTTSESAMGSPIVVSPILAPIVWGEDLQGWMAARGITTVTTIRRKSSKQAFLVTEGQLSLL